MPGRGRGRGARGGGVGRGRGGARGGRGRGRYGRGGAQRPAAPAWEISAADRAENSAVDSVINMDDNVTAFFTGSASVEDHQRAQVASPRRYRAALTVLERYGVDLTQNARVRGLAAAWSRSDHGYADALIEQMQCGIVEILKAVTILDAGRQGRVIEKKLKRLELAGKKPSPMKMGKIKSNKDNLAAISLKNGTATGAVCKHIKRWVKTVPKDKLEFYALHLPKEPWKKLADICHLNPAKDFPQLPWFLDFCFDKPAPDGSMVAMCRDLTPENVNELMVEYEIPYSHLRDKPEVVKALSDDSKRRLAHYTPLDQLLWYYEDLRCGVIDEIIEKRLAAGEQVTLATGKLLERLLMLKMVREDISLTNVEYEWDEETETLSKRVRKPDDTKAKFIHKLIPVAQKRLEQISLPLESPIVVMGDMSGSMDVAIRTATIIAAIMTAITKAKLVFFNTQCKDDTVVPTNMEQVLELAVSIEADAATAPAAALYPFYEKKEVVKTFIIVTDEEENETFKEFKFLDLYKRYCDEVYPAQLVFVSFLWDQHAPGQMVSELKDAGFSPIQFKFQATKPDLSKLDKLMGILSTHTASFEEQLDRVTQNIAMVTVGQGQGQGASGATPGPSGTSGVVNNAQQPSVAEAENTTTQGETATDGSTSQDPSKKIEMHVPE